MLGYKDNIILPKPKRVAKIHTSNDEIIDGSKISQKQCYKTITGSRKFGRQNSSVKLIICLID